MTLPRCTALYTLLVLALISPASHASRSTCIEWQRQIIKYDLLHLPKDGLVLTVQSFTNYTGLPGDEWLKQGLRMIIYDMLKAGAGKRAIILTGLLAKFHPRGSTPDYTVDGTFQRIEDKFRIFVRLSRGQMLVFQQQLDTQYRNVNTLFEALYHACTRVLKSIGIKYDDAKMVQIRDSTSNFDAFASFIKGRLLYFTFEPDKMETARIWFEESKRADFRYANAYSGLVDLYTFLGIYNKQLRKPYRHYFEKAEDELVKMHTLAKSKTIYRRQKGKTKYKIKRPSAKQLKLTNRFLKANAHFISGLHAANHHDWQAAANEFQQVVKLTPEDAITYYHLSQAYTKLGNTIEAHKALKTASSINKCLEQVATRTATEPKGVPSKQTGTTRTKDDQKRRTGQPKIDEWDNKRYELDSIRF